MSINAKLTERQQEILSFIKSEMEEGNVPDYKSIAKRFKFTVVAARDHVKRLAEKNCVSLNLFTKQEEKEPPDIPEVERSIVFDRLEYNPHFHQKRPNLFEIPIYDPILEKHPFFEDENVKGILTIPIDPIKHYKDECIAFKYNCESMSGSGFVKGDTVIAIKTKKGVSNDIVLAHVHGHNVLRHIHYFGTHVVLSSNTAGITPQSYEIGDVKVLCKYLAVQRWKTGVLG